MGQAPGLAAATGAYSCFEDEAGQSLRPPEARTWARRGCTPVAVVSGKGSGRRVRRRAGAHTQLQAPVILCNRA